MVSFPRGRNLEVGWSLGPEGNQGDSGRVQEVRGQIWRLVPPEQRFPGWFDIHTLTWVGSWLQLLELMDLVECKKVSGKLNPLNYVARHPKSREHRAAHIHFLIVFCAYIKGALVSFSCQLDTVQGYLSQSQLRDSLDSTGLWTPLWGIFLIANWYRKVHPIVGGSIPRQWILNCTKKVCLLVLGYRYSHAKLFLF